MQIAEIAELQNCRNCRNCSIRYPPCLYNYTLFNISSPTSLKKNFSPFPLPLRKYIVTLPHGGLRHEEQAILMRTILQWQTSPVASPSRWIKTKQKLQNAPAHRRDAPRWYVFGLKIIAVRKKYCPSLVCFTKNSYLCGENKHPIIHQLST